MATVTDIFTKVLPEDVVQYEIFLLSDKEDSELVKLLEDYRIKCLALAASLTCEYIWVNEGFNLCVTKTSEGNIPCLHGTTNFGEFVEDEWLIVSLLFSISEAYPELVCRVRDNDGEFILIEAADVLPRWLNPDTSKNRIFIHSGTLHIVPIPRTPGEILALPTGQPMLKDALGIVRNNPGLTQAHVKVNDCIQKRIEGFPTKALEYIQRTNVFIPESIVKILDAEPNLISAAVRAFYYRDSIDVKSCRVFKDFLPETRIWCQVPMNRCSYAQLMQQNFKADKRSGYVIPKNAGADFKGMDLGSKIAHGFEILCSLYSLCRTDVDCDTFDNAAFQKYVVALRKRDYFRGEMEGSKLYNELLENARLYFSRCNDESSENDSSLRVTAGKKIMSLKQLVSKNSMPVKRLSSANCRTDLPTESSDQWMYVDGQKMDEMLLDMKTGFEKLSRKKYDVTSSEETELSDLGAKMKNFVENISSFEGVEVPTINDPIDFDVDSFSTAISKLLGPFANLNMSENPDSASDEFLSSDSQSESDEEAGLGSEGEEFLGIMEQMDDELAGTNVGKSFVKSGVSAPQKNGLGETVAPGNSEKSSDDDEKQYKPVDIDLNLVQNFLESCSSEVELPGPTTTLLQSIGLNPESPET